MHAIMLMGYNLCSKQIIMAIDMMTQIQLCLFVKHLRANKQIPFDLQLSKGTQKMIQMLTSKGREKFDNL